MTDLLFNLTIGPLQFIYEIVYSGLFGLTHNYGWSLILLSFVTTFITVPLGQAVSVHIKKERLIESILDPQIKKIKSTSTGAEQSRRIRNLYERYAYNPLYSIRLAFGVLIQLPFLIGAYWMIAEHPSLNGVSFGPIADLSTPDQLLWGINLLPLIMTIANLGVVAISTQMPKRDRIQAVVVAGLFLILLYSAPSALLVYWTTNNVLLLIRTIAKKIQIKHCKSIETVFGLPSLKSQRLNTFLILGFTAYAIAAFATVLTLPYFGFSYHRIEIIKACTDTIFFALLLGLLTDKLSFESKINTYKSLIFLTITIFFAIRIFGYWLFDIDRTKLTTQLCLIIPISFVIFNFDTYKSKLSVIKNCDAHCLAIPSIVLISLLVGLYFPLNIYLSDPIIFGENIRPILLTLSRFTISCILFGLFCWFALQKWQTLSRILSFTLGLMGILSLIYGFLIVPEYGTINEFTLQNTNVLTNSTNRVVDGIVLIMAVSLLFVLALNNKLRLLRFTFLSFIVVLSCTSSFKVVSYISAISNEDRKNDLLNLSDEETIENIHNFFSFNKDGKNIVVVMLDMFSGGNMKEIANLRPDLINRLKGFVWFPDHMATGNSTMQGKPALLGGSSMTPLELSKDRTKSLEEKINIGWAKTLKTLEEKGFKISIFDNTWLDPTIINAQLPRPATIYDEDKFSQYFKKQWLGKADPKDKAFSTYKFLLSFGLFSTSPLSLKKKIYQNGQWLRSVDIKAHGYNFNLYWWAQLDALNKVSTVNDQHEFDSFIFIVNQVTHHPWLMSPKCTPQRRSEDWTRNSVGIRESNLQNEICSLEALANWFDWMKENGVYDNSRILVVSDHDGWNSSQLWELFKKGEYPEERPNSLFMIKDFQAKAAFKINHNALTSAVDIPSFIIHGLTNKSTNPWNDNSRVRCLSMTDWQRSHQGREYYNIHHNLCVKGSIFNKKNWYKTDSYNLSETRPYID